MKLLSAKRPGLKLSAVFLFLISAFSVLGASGDVDPGFNPQLTVDLSNLGGNLIIQPDGKIIVFGGYTPLNGSVGKSFVKRLNPDGSPDTTFDCQECRSFIPIIVTLQSDGKILIGGTARVIRVNQDGSLDNSFNYPLNTPTVPCQTKHIAAQTDGKVLVGCIVQNSSGIDTHEYVQRLNNDGSVDTGFATITPQINPQYITRVTKIVLQPDGKIVLGGGQTIDGGWVRRYNADGTQDNTFQASVSGYVTGIELMPDGNYLVSAWYSSPRGVTKLLANGITDTSFTTTSISQNEYVTGVKLLSNGQIYISIQTSNSFPTPSVTRFIRYNANGSVDNSFSQTFTNFGRWAVDSSDRIVVSRNGFFRLNFDGIIDSSFSPNISADGYANAVAVQSNGKMVIVGEFSKTNEFNSGRITRINADGTTDTSFNTGSGFDVAPKAVSLQPDGKILVSGRFTSYNGTPRTMVARLNADGSLDPTFNPTVIGKRINTIRLIKSCICRPIKF